MLTNVFFCFQLSQALRDFRLMECVDSTLYTEENKKEMMDLVRELSTLDKEFFKNKGLKLQRTQQTDEGKCLDIRLVFYTRGLGLTLKSCRPPTPTTNNF